MGCTTEKEHEEAATIVQTYINAMYVELSKGDHCLECATHEAIGSLMATFIVNAKNPSLAALMLAKLQLQVVNDMKKGGYSGITLNSLLDKRLN